MVDVFVDTRPGENNLFESLSSLLSGKSLDVEVRLQRRMLELGDVQVKMGEQVIIIERKTWSDLVSSLNDGRYSNQKARLCAERERNAGLKFLYLIEGAPPSYDGTTRNTANSNAYAALMKMALRDNITSIWSANSSDAARCVLYIIMALSKNGFESTAARAGLAEGYSKFVKHTSKRKNTEENQFEVMLTSIPGISPVMATGLVAVYPTVLELVQAYQAYRNKGATVAELDAMLADVNVERVTRGVTDERRTEDVKARRRIGQSISKKVREVFFTV
jgi:ERCC4-type nuclease